MRKAGHIFTTILLVLLLLLAAVIVVPNIFGIRTGAVVSGSMEPAYPSGSLVYAWPVEAGRIQKGDSITFQSGKRGAWTTQRVVEIDKENNQFIVKGDANIGNSPKPVSFDNVVGVVRFHIPLLGNIFRLLQTAYGKFIAVTIFEAVVLLLLLFGGREKSGEVQKTAKIRYRSPAGRKLLPNIRESERRTSKYSRKNRYTPQNTGRITRKGGGGGMKYRRKKNIRARRKGCTS